MPTIDKLNNNKMICNACKKTLVTKEVMKCRLCVDKFHIECLNIDKKQFFALTKDCKSNWICPSCTNVTRRARSQDTPVRQSTSATPIDDSNVVSYQSSDPNIISLLKEEVTMEKISKLLDDKLCSSLSTFMESFRKAIRDDVADMVKSEIAAAIKCTRDEFSATTDFICAEQNELKSDLKKAASTIKHLEDSKEKLEVEVAKLASRIVGIEKISRNCNLELQAVPERKNENVVSLFKKLCEVVKVSLEDGHVSACRRVAKLNTASNRPRNIVITLSSPRIRDMVLSATHRYNKTHPGRGIVSSDLDIAGESRRVFVNEHLSPEQKSLHAAARLAAKDRGYKYVWVKYGQIYVRKDDSASAILIKNWDSLDKIC